MTTPASVIDLRRARMVALGLGSVLGSGAGVGAGVGVGAEAAAESHAAESHTAEPAAIVGHLLAMQAQDLPQAMWALAVRMSGGTTAVDRIREAFDRGLIVRSWPMGGTVHLTAAADIGWMQQLAGPRVLAGWPKRRDYLGLTMADYTRAEDLARELLASGGRASRAELCDHWERSGLVLQKGWSYHLIWALCQNGVTVFGPMRSDSRELDLVLVDDWIGASPEPDREQALALLGHRFVRGHGPVRAIDLAWWSGLTVRDATRALSSAEGGERISVEGVEYWWDAASAAASGDGANALAEQLRLLPAFDEHLLGYKDRSIQVDPARSGAVMTSNGIARSTVVVDGRVVGVWRPAEGTVQIFSEEDNPTTRRRVAEKMPEQQARFEAFRAAERAAPDSPDAAAITGAPDPLGGERRR